MPRSVETDTIPALSTTALRRLEAELERLRGEVAMAAPATVVAALPALARATLGASLALAGSPLDPVQLDALLDEGRALGGYRLEAYLAARAYGEAARAVAALARWPAGTATSPLIRREEILTLHRLVTGYDAPAMPGRWRSFNLKPGSGGVVVESTWLIPRAIDAFVDRFGTAIAPKTSRFHALARAYERFRRIRPFASGNGRVGRLLLELAFRRLGDPPPLFARSLVRSMHRATAAADRGDHEPLALVLARAVQQAYGALDLPASGTAPDALRPLRDLAAPAELPALYKAAERGRLTTVRRGGTLATTAAWIAAYRAQRSRL